MMFFSLTQEKLFWRNCTGPEYARPFQLKKGPTKEPLISVSSRQPHEAIHEAMEGLGAGWEQREVTLQRFGEAVEE